MKNVRTKNFSFLPVGMFTAREGKKKCLEVTCTSDVDGDLIGVQTAASRRIA